MWSSALAFFRAVAMVLLFLLASPAGYGEPPADTSPEAIASRIIELTNEKRQSQGLQPLQRVRYLDQAALGHSVDMMERNFFSHYSETPGCKDTRTRIVAMGGWDALTGENIYRCQTSSPQTVAEHAVAQWLRSAAHYRILMSPNFNSIGVGVVCRGNVYTVTQDFSRQTIEVLGYQATLVDKGFDVALRGRIREGGPEGALFANDVLVARFLADGHGLFDLDASVPARSTLAVSLKVGPTRFAPKLVFPVQAAGPR
jgi:uncharacterized protein YkwD